MRHRVTIHEIDAATAALFRAEVTGAVDGLPTDDTVVELDFSEVAFMDSTGIAVLVELRTALRRDGRRLVVCRPSRAVRRLFEVTALTDFFDEA